MRNVSKQLAEHLKQEVTTLCTIWKLELTDGACMGFTDHDADLSIDGITYKASTGMSSSHIDQKSDFSVDNLEVMGILNSSGIQESDILKGRYDFAKVMIAYANFKDLSQGSLNIKSGFLGEISIRQQQFVAEVRGLSQKLTNHIGNLYSPMCRATFGDMFCKANVKNYSFKGKVRMLLSAQSFQVVDVDGPDGYFANGELVWTSGANISKRIEIRDYVGDKFTLMFPMPNKIAAGDTFTAIAGCDKAFTTCCTKFKNAVNFRGEPHVPGMDKLLTTAGTMK